MIGRGTANATYRSLRLELSAWRLRVEDLAHCDATGHELGACGVDVGDYQVEASFAIASSFKSTLPPIAGFASRAAELVRFAVVFMVASWLPSTRHAQCLIAWPDGERHEECSRSCMALLLALAFLIGIVAGLRSLTPLAIVSWATRLGWLELPGAWHQALGNAVIPWVFTVLALFEILVVDQSRKTPNRTSAIPFASRVISGFVCGAAVGAHAGVAVAGALIGTVGAVAGTLGGAAMRRSLARELGKDRPAALFEDGVAIGLGILVVVGLT